MQVSDQTQAVLLLTSHFGKSDPVQPQPLSTSEWARFAIWLKDHGLQPASLLGDDPRHLLSGWVDRSVTQHRIEYLLGRGGALGLALEKWQRAGLWVLTRSDPDYPDRLKKRLKTEAPPLFFGCGNRSLLSKGGIAVVGSRDASNEDLSSATQLGADAAARGFSIVSGGARGVDESAMVGALEREGTVTGVLADSLLRSATSAKYRKHLMSDDLVLVSPFNPEAGFNTGNAMARNRYIYCLADAAIVVTSTRDKGGTWTGAIENLKSGWVPLWVKPQSSTSTGNAELVRRGAHWLPNDTLLPLSEALTGDRTTDEGSLLDLAATPPRIMQTDVEARVSLEQAKVSADKSQPTQHSEIFTTLSFYELFLRRMESFAVDGLLTVEQLLDRFDISKLQLNAWLKRAVGDKQINKLRKPVRYQWRCTEPSQASMFDDERNTGGGR